MQLKCKSGWTARDWVSPKSGPSKFHSFFYFTFRIAILAKEEECPVKSRDGTQIIHFWSLFCPLVSRLGIWDVFFEAWASETPIRQHLVMQPHHNSIPDYLIRQEITRRCRKQLWRKWSHKYVGNKETQLRVWIQNASCKHFKINNSKIEVTSIFNNADSRNQVFTIEKHISTTATSQTSLTLIDSDFWY